MQMRLVLLSLLLLSCSSELPKKFSPTIDSRPAIIFVPGYYGSALRNKSTGERTFLTGSEIFFSNDALSLFQKELATPSGPELEPDGLLVNVPVIPHLYSVDVYGTTLALLGADSRYQVVPFAYDWRADIPESARNLGTLVQQLQAKGVNEISIVAHSMGGLVATYYLAYGQQDPMHAQAHWEGAQAVSKIAFLGTPFRGVFGIFRNINRGANFSWNRHLLPTDTVASFPASYQLLPFQGAHTLRKNGALEQLNLGDIAFWSEHRLSLLSTENLSQEILKRRRAFLAEQVARAQLISGLLQLRQVAPPLQLRVLNVQGTGRKTVNTAFFENGKFLFDTDKLRDYGLNKEELMADGDAVVTLESSTLPKALDLISTKESTEIRHDLIPSDPFIIGKIMGFLREPLPSAKSASAR